MFSTQNFTEIISTTTVPGKVIFSVIRLDLRAINNQYTNTNLTLTKAIESCQNVSHHSTRLRLEITDQMIITAFWADGLDVQFLERLPKELQEKQRFTSNISCVLQISQPILNLTHDNTIANVQLKPVLIRIINCFDTIQSLSHSSISF